MRSLIKNFLLLLLIAGGSHAWSPNPFALMGSQTVQVSSIGSDSEVGEQETGQASACVSRRMWLGAAAMNIGLLGAGASAMAETASEATIYRSGKPPMVPGAKPQDKNDVKGTKKDPDFLRSVSDCRSQCQNTPDSDGLARSKEDCLSECQDICCKTYAQCTFDIVPRI